MNFNKTGIATALVALFLSGSALAYGGDDIHVDNYVDDGNGNSQWEDSANVRDSHNVDTTDSNDVTTTDSNDVTTTNKMKDSNNIDTTDSNDVTTTNKMKDSNNVDTTDSHDVTTTNKMKDSNNVETTDSNDITTTNKMKNSNNVDSNDITRTSTTNTTTNTTTNNTINMEADVVIANSSQMGTVGGNSVDSGGGFGRFPGRAAGASNTNNLGGFASSAGITTVAQNAGANSLVQQNVTTNASVSTD